jgi:hypothetical protein
MSVLDMISAEIPPTRTYARRSYVWLPDGDGGGILTVNLSHSRRPGTKVESDTYSLQETADPAHPVPGRTFLLLNLTDRDQEQPYEVFVADDPRRDDCTCTADRCNAPCCKHKDCCRSILEAGGFDPQ